MESYGSSDEPRAASGQHRSDQPVTPAGPPTGRSRGARLTGLAIGTLWLALSIGAGIWLIVASPGGGTKVKVSATHLTASSQQSSYGGDAYTGIQNAASDTEHAVVDGANEMVRMQVALAQSSAQQRHDIAKHLATGLGVLVIGLGVTNFTLAWQRFAPA